MSRCLSLLTLVWVGAIALPALALESFQIGPDLSAAPNETAASTPPENAQFMAWSDGRCVTLRYAVRSPGHVHFYKAVPQGFNPKILLVNYATHPISAPPRIHVGQVTFTDYGYDSIEIPAFSVTIHILRYNDPPSYAQSMAYVQSGSLITQTLNPGNAVACLQLVSFRPLKYRKVIGHAHHCHNHCYCPWSCYDPCHSHCHSHSHSHCHHHCHSAHHGLSIRQGAVRDDGVTPEVLVEDPLQRVTLIVPVLRP